MQEQTPGAAPSFPRRAGRASRDYGVVTIGCLLTSSIVGGTAGGVA